MKNMLASAAVLGVLASLTTLPASADDKPFCSRTKGDIGRSVDCLYASYQECKSSIANIYAECYRNPRAAYGQQDRKNTN